jgi:hypothetical protein
MNDQLTPEEIQQHYSAALDSVNFINEINAGQHDERMTAEEKADALQRNKDHLKIMLAKDFWQGQDLTPLRNAAQ